MRAPCIIFACKLHHAPCVQVKPLSWPMHIHRKVLSEALHSPASNAELAAATAAVQAEFARLGRFSSFSSHQLAAQPVQGQEAVATADAAGNEEGSSGGVVLALVPGAMGPRTHASAAALEALEAAAAASSGSSSSSSKAGEGPQKEQGQPQQDEAQQQQQQQHEAEGSDRSVSGVLCEMDAALIGLMQDMDIMMPAEGAAIDKQT
jgi:hypothetical protein